jgi:isoamylase
MNSAARIGSSSPLGATMIEGGANFSLFSRGATGVELLFDNESDARPSRVIPIDPAANRTYQYWHYDTRPAASRAWRKFVILGRHLYP